MFTGSQLPFDFLTCPEVFPQYWSLFFFEMYDKVTESQARNNLVRSWHYDQSRNLLKITMSLEWRVLTSHVGSLISVISLFWVLLQRLLSLVVVMAHESEVLTACVYRAMKRKGSKGASLGINLGPDNAQPHCRSLSVSTDWSFWCWVRTNCWKTGGLVNKF